MHKHKAHGPAASHMHSAVGMADGCGYDLQLTKYIICEVCRSCHLILSVLKPVFQQLGIRQILLCLQLSQVPIYM